MGYKTTCQCTRCRLERENKRLKKQEELEVNNEKRITELEALLERSVRLEEEVIDGERVFIFKVGAEGHNVAQWTDDGDGVASDNVFCEKPALKYAVTTTPIQRCLRMVLEMVHWPVLCAMLVGPGDGEFKTAYDQGEIETVD